MEAANAIEQYFPVVLFTMLYKVVRTFEFVGKSLSVTIQMKATEEFFPVVLFIMPYNRVLTFESVGKAFKRVHSNPLSSSDYLTINVSALSHHECHSK